MKNFIVNICKNKNLFFIFAMSSMLVTFSVRAQEKQQKPHFDREVFQMKKNAFVTAELALTPEEAAAFIPLTEELDRKKFEIGRKCKKLSREIRRKENKTEADYDAVIQVCLEVKMKEAELEKEYYEKFSQVLSSQKLYKYRNAEFKFIRSYFSNKK